MFPPNHSMINILLLCISQRHYILCETFIITGKGDQAHIVSAEDTQLPQDDPRPLNQDLCVQHLRPYRPNSQTDCFNPCLIWTSNFNLWSKNISMLRYDHELSGMTIGSMNTKTKGFWKNGHEHSQSQGCDGVVM